MTGMSFSSDVKEELARRTGKARHCRIAETAAILYLSGDISQDEQGSLCVQLQTENESVSKKYFTLLKKTYNIITDIVVSQNPYLKKGNIYTITIKDHAKALALLESLKMVRHTQEQIQISDAIQPMIIQMNCCKRAFLRGAFLATGSISDPRRSYHFEIVCQTEDKARLIQSVMNSLHIDARIVARKKTKVVYVKEGEQIVELLGMMEANVALMELENIRILKGMRNSVNRQVNCEAANINKTVNASVKQIEDIHYIMDSVGLQDLGEGLEEIARLRLQYPEASLKELGTMLNPQIGKSGVNHRLRKLSAIAEELRGNKEEHDYGQKVSRD